ncbi:hypothetical protein K435DRAFT_810489 [Dendrothele bispora CBS 962.96]|uniref:Uncharacterized protein n=1 Tax=Dendrothele bispora (strain CBS 962.96) TaxID=1314807 RepID=A0A4V6T4Y8_DENBC|nr:hypothetical protein K435DRAFT_810489 [Dendrothele bispora CBS 962.96]
MSNFSERTPLALASKILEFRSDVSIAFSTLGTVYPKILDEVEKIPGPDGKGLNERGCEEEIFPFAGFTIEAIRDITLPNGPLLMIGWMTTSAGSTLRIIGPRK